MPPMSADQPECVTAAAGTAGGEIITLGDRLHEWCVAVRGDVRVGRPAAARPSKRGARFVAAP